MLSAEFLQIPGPVPTSHRGQTRTSKRMDCKLDFRPGIPTTNQLSSPIVYSFVSNLALFCPCVHYLLPWLFP